MRKLLFLFLVAAMAGCGGGGGGSTASPGSVVPPAPGPGSTGLTVNFSTSTLAFEYNEGEEPRAKTMTASASGTTDKDVLIGAEVTGTGIATPIKVVVDVVTRSAVITVVPARGLAPGTYTGTIRMLACANQDCSLQHAGSPHMVNYTVMVRPGLKPTPSSLSLAAAETASAAPTRIAFVLPAPNATVNASVAYEGGQSGWLVAQVSGNAVDVQANAASLPAGSYKATLTLAAPASGQSVNIPVSLTVSAGLSVPERTSVTVSNATTVQQMQGTIALALAPGVTARTWNAASDQPWLKLVQASGSFGTQPAWTIDQAAFALLPNNAHYMATVRITTDSALPARNHVVDVQKSLSEIRGLDSVALLAGQGGNVMVYGSGFDKLPAGASSVEVAGAAPIAVSVLSDKVMRLALPAMSLGDHTVSLKSASGLATAPKAIHVTGSNTFSYQALDTQGLKTTVVWDAVSKSAFVVNSTLKSVMRYAAVAGKFQLVATRSFPFVDSIAMAPDHSALVLQSGTSTVYKLSPVDLSTIATFAMQSAGSGTENTMTVPLTIMGDNRLMHYLYGWIDLDTGATTPLSYTAATAIGSPASWGAVSGDGLRMIRPDSGLYSPRGPMYRTDLLSGKFSAYASSITPFFYRYAVNHDGSSWAFNDQVVDFDLNIKGNYKLPDGWLANQMVFSRNGSRLYSYAQSATVGVKPRIYVFDTSKVLTSTVNFPVLGYIEFDDLPNCPYNPNKGYSDGCYTFESHITISDDDLTLFVAGDTKFVVVPIPGSMQTASAGPSGNSALTGWVALPRGQ